MTAEKQYACLEIGQMNLYSGTAGFYDKNMAIRIPAGSANSLKMSGVPPLYTTGLRMMYGTPPIYLVMTITACMISIIWLD